MKIKNLTALAIAALLGTAGSFAQGRASFTYADPDQQPSGWGTGKNETYNVAIFVSDPAMVGKKIVGLRVAAGNTDKITDLKGFLTTQLKAEKPEGETKKRNVPDICEVAGEDHHADGYYSVSFAEPYTLTESGVFVGYTLTVTGIDAASNAPIAVSGKVDDNGFWIYTSRTYMNWSNRSRNFNQVSAMEVIFEGDFDTSALGASIDSSKILMAGESFNLPVTLINHGTDKLTGYEYTVKIGDRSYTGTRTLPTPVELSYGARFEDEVKVDIPTEAGMVDLEFTIDKVNGMVNNDPGKTVKVSIGMLGFIPKKRVLVEEYTGLWCGNCTRGYAAMEYMANHHPYDFIGIAYHGGNDPLMTISQSSFPNSVDAYPSVVFERNGTKYDPYRVKQTSGFGLEAEWLEQMKNFTPVDVSVSAYLDENDVVQVTANTMLVRDYEHPLGLAFVLVGNKLEDPTWAQANYHAGGNKADFAIEEMEQFLKGGKEVYDLEFNDVALMQSNTRGETGTMKGGVVGPDGIVVNERMEDKYAFALSQCRTIPTVDYTVSINPAMQCKEKDALVVVAAVIDKTTGYALNAAKCRVATVGVDKVAVDNGAVVGTEYFDLSGNKVVNPGKGLYIKVDTFANGSRVSSKIIK